MWIRTLDDVQGAKKRHHVDNCILWANFELYPVVEITDEAKLTCKHLIRARRLTYSLYTACFGSCISQGANRSDSSRFGLLELKQTCSGLAGEIKHFILNVLPNWINTCDNALLPEHQK